MEFESILQPGRPSAQAIQQPGEDIGMTGLDAH
jgi:hypothetical protein